MAELTKVGEDIFIKSMPQAAADKAANLLAWQGYSVEYRSIISMSTGEMKVAIVRARRPTRIWEWLMTDGTWVPEKEPRDKFADLFELETCDDCSGELDAEGECDIQCWRWRECPIETH